MVGPNTKHRVVRFMVVGLFLAGALLSFAVIGGQGIWGSAGVKIAEQDDPFHNSLDIFEPEGIQVGGKMHVEPSQNDDVVNVLHNWEYTDFTGSKRR